jgi:hypothetical protein
MTFPFRLEPLSDEHERTLFRGGEDALDRYFQTQVTQDIRRRVANCFVAVETATSQIAAWYTISAASIPLTDLPPEETRRLPRYPPFASGDWRWVRDFRVAAWVRRCWPMPPAER